MSLCKSAIRIVLGSVLVQSTFIDLNYISSVDSIECNKIFPFTFGTPETGTTLVDWDLQNFSDNYQQFVNSNTNYAVT